MDESRTKIISDIEAEDNVISVKKPFKLYKDRKRRYIRLEISEPITYSILKDRSNGFQPQPDSHTNRGSILNISAGGILIISDMPVEEGSILIMKISLQEIEIIDKIIGVVKRADADDGEWLIGIEFISREFLVDHFSSAELDMIPKEIASFDERLKKILNKYVYYKRSSVDGK